MGKPVSFLDLFITSSPICWKTYFKPNSTFQYTPFHSLHHKSVFRGIVLSQIDRLRKTCKMNSDFRRSINFLFGKLGARGFDQNLLDICLADFLSNASIISEPDRSRVVPFKLRYSSLLQDSCRTPAGHLQDTCRTPAGHLQDSCRTRAGHLQDSCRTPAGLLQDSCRTPAGHLQDTCRTPA